MEIKIEEKHLKSFWNSIILIFIGIVLMFSYLLTSEILQAKKECEILTQSKKYNL